MKKLNGTLVAQKIKDNLKKDIFDNFLSKKLNPPKLAVIMIGDSLASKIYVEGKIKACLQVGIESQIVTLANNVSERELKNIIEDLNNDFSVDGILLQLPVPKHLDTNKVINLISPQKDVDGLTNINLGKLLSKDNSGFFGCTPSGIIRLLKDFNVSLKGKDAVIINRSLLVGKPLSLMLLNEDCSVMVCHSKTKNLKDKTLNADIVVVAVGKKNFLKSGMIKKGAIVVDVGINRDEKTKKICGDIDFEKISKKAKLITPVPGGVGPMTIAMLLLNTYKACLNHKKTTKDKKK